MEKIPTDPVISNPDTWAAQVEADISATQREIEARKRAGKIVLDQLLTDFVIRSRRESAGRPKSIQRH